VEDRGRKRGRKKEVYLSYIIHNIVYILWSRGRKRGRKSKKF
jgi:hypothetical protein